MSDIFVHPCGIWFGGGRVRLRTVLGSCVAVTLWHPVLRLGGMCHFMMDACGEGCGRDGRPEACYADGAMRDLHARIRAYGCRPCEFEAKLFGGGSMFAQAARRGKGHAILVHERNIEAGLALVVKLGHRVVAQHLGGEGHRHLVFDVHTGKAWLKHTPRLVEIGTADPRAAA